MVQSGKTRTISIIGLGSHSGTGEDWADDENGMTSADAQAFKRACACFGLGRYFYDFHGPWVDLDEKQQPKRSPSLPVWAIPENWRKGLRAAGRNGSGNGAHANGANPNGHGGARANGRQVGVGANLRAGELDTRIVALAKAVGPNLHRSILREYGKAEQPKLIKDVSTKQRVLEILESAARGFERLHAATSRVDPKMVESLLEKLQAPRLTEIPDMKMLRTVVFAIEHLADSRQRTDAASHH
jgi:hypothetical protein